MDERQAERTPDAHALVDTQTSQSRGRERDVDEPERIGRYRVLGTIGAGGGGVVVEAYDPELDRAIAIKLLTGDEDGSVGRERFQREAQAIARLSHPNVVSVYDTGRHGDTVFIAMEYVDGGSLKSWIAAGDHSVREIVDRFVQAGRGLAAAHDKGLVHRDFKPSNVLVGRDGVVRVADFGLARACGPIDEAAADRARDPGIGLDVTLTAAGLVVGTPLYMAPEQLAGTPVDERADQYAFCVSLWQALAGRPPFGSIERGAPPRLPRQVGAPAWLDRVLARGMAVDPEQRFPTMHALLAAIERGRGRRRRLAIAAAAVAAIAAAALAFTLTGRGDGQPSMCRGFDDQLASSWSAPRRGAVERAFTTAAPSFGGDAFATVAGQLDDYGASWIDARTRACEATRVRGEQSDELLDLRMACLDRRRHELDQLVGALAGAGAEEVERANDAVNNLVPVSVCDDGAALRDRPRAPETSWARSEATALAHELAAVKVMTDLARVGEGLPRAEGARIRARAAGLPDAAAEASLWLGRLRTHAGAADAGRAAFEDAIVDADAAGDDRLRFEALLALIEADSGTPDTASAIDVATRQADGLATRLGDRDPDRAAYELARAISDQQRGHPVTAVEHAARALALIPEDAWTRRTEAMRVYAYTLEDVGRREEALEVGLASLALARAHLSPWHPQVGRILQDVGYAHAILDRLEPAERYARRAVEVFERVFGENHPRTAAALGDLAIVYMRGERFREALEVQKRSYAIRLATLGPDDKLTARGLTNMSITYRRLGELDHAEAHARRAVDAYRASMGPRHPETGAAIGRVAAVLEDRGACRDAIELYREAIDIIRAANPNHPRLLDQIRGIAGCLETLRQPAAAADWLEQGLAISDIAEEAPVYTGHLYFAAARNIDAAGRGRARAIELARRAHDSYRAAGASDDLAAVDAWLARRDSRPGQGAVR